PGQPQHLYHAPPPPAAGALAAGADRAPAGSPQRLGGGRPRHRPVRRNLLGLHPSRRPVAHLFPIPSLLPRVQGSPPTAPGPNSVVGADYISARNPVRSAPSPVGCWSWIRTRDARTQRVEKVFSPRCAYF